MVIFLLTILAWVSGEVRRCALPDIVDRMPQLQQRRSASVLAPRQSAAIVDSYQTDHFVIWWTTRSTGEDAVHNLQGAAAVVASRDSVPAIVRVAADALEHSWRVFVDTLGYLPPKASATSYHWDKAVPAGKYPVEFLDVAVALNLTGNYFGIAYPDGWQGRSLLALAADVTTFGRWNQVRDLDGSNLGLDYGVDWAEATRATCAHELFHAIQFNYEIELTRHGFHEASAVALEQRAVPASRDYLQFSSALSNLGNLVPFPTGTASLGYPHGWFVRGMMTDLGEEVVRDLWESRKVSTSQPPEFLSSMRSVLSRRGGSFDSQLVRNAMRLALTGKRSTWRPAGLSPYPDAAQFPILSGILAKKETTTELPLPLGGFQILVDTLRPREDRLLVWIPDPGAVMGWARTSASGNSVSWHPGSVRYSAAEATRSAWAFANPGNPPALRAQSSDESSLSYWSQIAAPVRVPAHAGQGWTWTSPAGPVLTGESRTEAAATPLLHLDVWKPSASKDPFGATVARAAGGHAIVLEDADRVLVLKDAALRLPGMDASSAFLGSGDGKWTPVAVSGSDGSTTIALGELDLSKPVRVLFGSAVAPRAKVLEPRPNPSRQGEAIRFPISGSKGSERLDILAADGGLVREIAPQVGETEVVWDLRNRENRMVRPGVYMYVWRGTAGVTRGKLLIAD